MKKTTLSALAFLLFIPSHAFGAQEVTPPQAQEAKKNRFQAVTTPWKNWKKGIAAAKKKHWYKKQLTPQERRYYQLALALAGSLTVLLASIGLGVYDRMHPTYYSTYNYDPHNPDAAEDALAEYFARRIDEGFDPNAKTGTVFGRMLSDVPISTPFLDIINRAHTKEDHYVPVVKALIRAGAKIPGNVFLAAVEKGFPDLVGVLVDGGAPLDATNRQGKTALDIAREMQEANDTDDIRRIIQILQIAQGITPTKSASKQ